MTTTNVSMKYLNLGKIGGRGGALRFFMLANNIPYTEELIPMDETWGKEKQRMVASGENPCGTVPVIFTEKDGATVALGQHIATGRYLAAVNDISPSDPYECYVQDMVADEYQNFRNTWVTTFLTGTDEEKELYMTETIIAELTKFEALYATFLTSSPYLSKGKNGQPLWGDSALFGLIYDNIKTGLLAEETLKNGNYPSLVALYESFISIPAIAEWIGPQE